MYSTFFIHIFFIVIAGENSVVQKAAFEMDRRVCIWKSRHVIRCFFTCQDWRWSYSKVKGKQLLNIFFVFLFQIDRFLLFCVKHDKTLFHTASRYFYWKLFLSDWNSPLWRLKCSKDQKPTFHIFRSPFRFLCNQEKLKQTLTTEHSWLEYSVKKALQHKG